MFYKLGYYLGNILRLPSYLIDKIYNFYIDFKKGIENSTGISLKDIFTYVLSFVITIIVSWKASSDWFRFIVLLSSFLLGCAVIWVVRLHFALNRWRK